MISLLTFTSTARFTGYSVLLTPAKRPAPRSGRIPAIVEIQKETARYFRISMPELLSSRRAREVARPRQVSMYLAKQLTPRSLPDIGIRHGDRDHTTVIHAVRQVNKLRAQDPEFDADVVEIARLLGCAAELAVADGTAPPPVLETRLTGVSDLFAPGPLFEFAGEPVS